MTVSSSFAVNVPSPLHAKPLTVAAAVLGNPDFVTYVEVGPETRFTSLVEKKTDVVMYSSTWTLSRESRYHVAFPAIYLFDGQGFMVKGGGAALTREKIVAALAQRFVCIVDESKRVQTLGRFPLPVEVIPMAAQQITRRFAAMGGQATLRLKDGQPLVTDNGQHILDVRGLSIAEPLAFESEVNQWPGVVTVGVFAHQKAAVCLMGTAQGVQTIEY